MSYDLTRNLHDLGAESARGVDLPLDALLTRLHRRRAGRNAAVAATGVAAAAGIAVAGTAGAGLLRDPAPAPVATEVPGPTATPDPTPTSTPVPLADLGCGRLLSELGTVDPTTLPITSTLGSAGPVALSEGGTLTADVTVGSTEARVDGREVFERLQHAVVQDGVVVALARTRLDEFGFAQPMGPYPATVAVTITVDPCDTSAATLAPGEYELYAAVRLDDADAGAGDPTVLGGPWVVTAGEPVPAAEPTAPPEPLGTPAAEPPVDPHPPVADLVISTSGLGPLRVGVPLGTNPGAAMLEWDPDLCLDLQPDPGQWVVSGYAEDTAYDGRLRPPFGAEVEPDGISRIDVLGVTPRTAEGVGVGTPLTDLQAVYPALQGPVTAFGDSRTWWISDASGSLVFETVTPGASEATAGRPEAVAFVRVLAPGVDPAYTIFGTDDTAGGCF